MDERTNQTFRKGAMTEVELIEQAALKVGMKSLMNHGAAS